MRMTGALSLRQRLLLLTAIALLPALVIMLVYEASMRSTRMAEAEAFVLRMSEVARGEMFRALTGAGTLMIAIGEAPVTRAGAENCAGYIASVRAELPQILDIALADADGDLLCHDGASSAPALGEILAATLEGAGPPRFSIGSYTETPAGAVLPVVLTRRNEAQAVESHVLISISIGALQRIIVGESFGINTSLTVADRSGRVLLHHPPERQLAGAVVPTPYAELLAQGRPGTARLIGVLGTRRIVGYQPATDILPIAVFVGLPQDELMAPINRATAIGIAAVAAGALLAFFIAWHFGRVFIYRPVLRILETIQRWRAGDRSARTGAGTEGAELGLIASSVDALFDEIDRREAAQKQAERQRDLFAAEVRHRVKNLLAVVQAIISQTLASQRGSREVQALRDRVEALVRAHAALFAEEAPRLDMGELVADAVAPFVDPESGRLRASGPPIRLQPKPALSLSLALHELCTNAVKHGAFSTPSGRVEVRWEIVGDALRLTWEEAGGPPVRVPDTTGFGTILIRQALEAETRGTVVLDYAAGGLRFEMRAPLENVSEAHANRRERTALSSAAE
jgi:two-component sensor histidine kinase